MSRSFLRLSAVGLALLGPALACGRSGLFSFGSGGSESATGGAGGATGGSGGAGGVTNIGGGGAGGVLACDPGETIPCGSDVGACQKGLRTCADGIFGPCVGDVGPVAEMCNGLDDNCDGATDEGFNLGAACDDGDTDLCLDSVITCAGCSPSANNTESCNGFDDNCNGVIDADCDVGDCQPALVVTGSIPSSPNCIDFPVETGSTGTIEYPCGGGPVSAQLGSIQFTGSVQNGVVSLDGVAVMTGPDGCLWQFSHHIGGNVTSGQLNYSYSELLLNPHPGCWSPCTETGTVQVNWAGN